MSRFTAIKAQLDSIEKEWTNYTQSNIERARRAREFVQQARDFLLQAKSVEADRCLASAIEWLEDNYP